MPATTSTASTDYIGARQVEREYGYTRNKLVSMEQEGKLRDIQRTPGGHRRYSRDEIETLALDPSSESPDDQVALGYREFGDTGLRRWGGTVYEERLREMRGRNGRILKREMRLNDPVISAVFFGISNAMKRADWRVKPESESPADREAAEFLESCMFEDMSFTWEDTLTFVIDEMLEQGFSVLELVYKKRLGDTPPAYTFNPAPSEYEDGRIGWRKWAIRPAESLLDGDEWIFDDHGGIQGIRQAIEAVRPGQARFISIPIKKLLHFRTTVHPANNPEGLAIHRGMYSSWWYGTNLQELEGIGIERDLAGLPVVYMGRGTTKTGANSDYELAKELVVNIRRDEQAGVVIPHPKLGTGSEGEGMLLELLSSSSRRAYDTNEIINRYDKRKAMVVLAQFIMLGMDRIGSYALSKHQGDLFVIAVESWIKSIAGVINRHAVPRLMKMNSFPKTTGYPKLVPGSAGVPDLQQVGEFINRMVGAAVLTPDDDMERTVRQWAGVPDIPIEVEGRERVPAQMMAMQMAMQRQQGQQGQQSNNNNNNNEEED